jgi:nitronate monooxygenase
MPLPPQLVGRLRAPAVAAPMFLVSGPDLVVECCRAGVLGTFPALNERTSVGFEAWLATIEARLARSEDAGEQPAPFGVNLIVHKTNPRLDADLALCVKHRVPVVITSLGCNPEVISAIQSYGGIVFHDVINRKQAEKAAARGVDGIVCVSAGAGGHAGTINPFALVTDVRRVFEGTILLGGCINTGAHIAAARLMGADLAYIGTRFIATSESLAADDYKAMLLASGSGDVIYTAAISGISGNFLTQSLVNAGVDLGKIRDHVDVADELMDSGAKAWKTIWTAGHGTAGIDEVPSVRDLCRRLLEEFDAAGNLLRQT